jgi:hypothetical protein
LLRAWKGWSKVAEGLATRLELDCVVWPGFQHDWSKVAEGLATSSVGARLLRA